MGRLAASIAHEINNPLESLMNLVYIAERAEPEEVGGYLTAMDQELRRMQMITAQSLRFSRQSHKPQAIHPGELLDSVLHLQKGRIEGAGGRVERRDRFCDSIVCMESEIRQVLNNLISNATDARKGSNGRVLVRTRASTDKKTGRSGVAITVADNGAGMTQGTLGRLYQAFFTTKGSKGTGLGLWISKGIVERHHGRLTVRSQMEGERTGTVFRLFLPYQGAADSGEVQEVMSGGEVGSWAAMA